MPIGRDKSGPYKGSPSQRKDEVVLRHRNTRIAQVQQHRSTRPFIDASTASNGERRIRPIVKEWAFNRDLPMSKECRPEALPLSLSSCNRARALTIINPNLLFIGGIEDWIVEAQYVTQRHFGRMELLHCVSNRVFDYVNLTPITCVGCRAVVQIAKHKTCKEANQEHDGGGENKQFLHEDFPLCNQ